MNTKEQLARAIIKFWDIDPDKRLVSGKLMWESTLPLLEAVLASQLEINAAVKAVGDEARMEEKPADYIYRAMTQGIQDGK